MRTLTNTFGAAVAQATVRPEAMMELQDLSYAVGDPAQAEVEYIAHHPPVSNAVRVVGVLAFGQSLLFLLLWLLICASAGAATATKAMATKKAEFNPPLQTSNYEPTNTRNPFGPAVVVAALDTKVPTSVPIDLQLDGILYSATNPSAIVNGQLVTLNKTVTLGVGSARIPVKATAITRQIVTLEVNGQKVDLQMDSEKTTVAPSPAP